MIACKYFFCLERERWQSRERKSAILQTQEKMQKNVFVRKIPQKIPHPTSTFLVPKCPQNESFPRSAINPPSVWPDAFIKSSQIFFELPNGKLATIAFT